jgi:3-oxoacyl-(acyl-carrier-protein) synthase
MKDSKIVITGFGVITAAGDTAGLWNAVLNKQNHITSYKDETFHDCPVKAVGRVTSGLENIFPEKIMGSVSRHAELAGASLKECISISKIKDKIKNGYGLIFASASNGQDQIKLLYDNIQTKNFNEINYDSINSISNAGVCHLLAGNFNINGYIHSVEGASCSGMIAVITAYNLIKAGICDRVFCTTGDANIFPATFLFYSRKVRMGGTSLSFFGKIKDPEQRELDDYIQPFCQPRYSDRGVIAEAGGTILIESLESAQSRRSDIFAEIEDVSYYFHSDNFHGTDRDQTGLKKVLNTFKNSSPDSIYMPVTGCYILDYYPYKISGEYFPGLHCFSAEPVIGHTGAATSMINIILAVLSLKNKTLLPTKNLKPEYFDPQCMLTPSSESLKEKDINKILILSSGWGGYNGSCLVKKYEG